jgi:hypothetical protein
MNDMNGDVLAIGDDVVVYPEDWLGVVIDIKQDADDVWYAVVCDQDDEIFSLEGDFLVHW